MNSFINDEEHLPPFLQFLKKFVSFSNMIGLGSAVTVYVITKFAYLSIFIIDATTAAGAFPLIRGKYFEHT